VRAPFKPSDRQRRWWHAIIIAIRETGESYLSSQLYNDPVFVTQAGYRAFVSLLAGGGVLVLVGLLLWIAPKQRAAVWLLLALGMGEAAGLRARSMDSSTSAARSSELKAFLEAHPGELSHPERGDPNAALGLRAAGIWGSTPGHFTICTVLGATQGIDRIRRANISRYARPSAAGFVPVPVCVGDRTVA